MKSFIGVLFFFAINFSTTAWAAPEDVYGRWGNLVVKPGNGLVLTMSLEFSETDVTIYNRCSFRGNSLVVSTSVPRLGSF